MFVVHMKAGARFGRVTVYHVKNVTCLVTGRHLPEALTAGMPPLLSRIRSTLISELGCLAGT